MILALLAACAPEPDAADPRPDIRERLGAQAGAVPTAEVLEERLLLGQLPAGCAGAKARVRSEGSDDDWRALWLVAARMGARPDGCLSPEDGDALATWSAERSPWREVRAEWLAARGNRDGAEAALRGGGRSSTARVRIALARGDTEAARRYASEVVGYEPRDVLACRLAAQGLLEDEREPAWALEATSCGGLGDRAPEILRLRGEVWDRVGETAAAEEAYRKAGADVHLAALLYQDSPTPERVEEARRLLREGSGPVALHGVWLALLHGGDPSVAGLDHSLPATVARALVRGGEEDLAALAAAPGAPAAVVRARLLAARGDREGMDEALDAALAAEPFTEPVHRARIALRVSARGDVAGALADWAALDPDHVAAVGARGSRDLPWAALVPETWDDLARRHPDARMRPDAPSGKDSIGERIRAARALPTERARADALGALEREVGGLDGLAAERYRLGPPPGGIPAGAP